MKQIPLLVIHLTLAIYDLWDYNSISSSPTCNTSAVFQDASMIMTLAERLNMTRFKPYQKKVIYLDKIA